jgi:hypothetical protein
MNQEGFIYLPLSPAPRNSHSGRLTIFLEKPRTSNTHLARHRQPAHVFFLPRFLQELAHQQNLDRQKDKTYLEFKKRKHMVTFVCSFKGNKQKKGGGRHAHDQILRGF